MTPTRPESTTTAVSAAAPKNPLAVPLYAWYVVFVLMLCYTLSYIDRQIIGTFVGPLKKDLGISDTAVGLLQGLAFAVFYTFMGLPLGRAVDRFNRRNLIVGGIVVWSLFTAACAAASNFPLLFLARMGVGVGEATLGPAAFSILSDYFPKERLGTAANIFYFGNLFGASLALIVGGAIREAVGTSPTVLVPVMGVIASWRLVFLILGIPGLLFALLVFSVREPIRKNLMRTSTGAVSQPTVSETIVQMRARWQSVFGISLAYACQAACNYGFMGWATEYFLRIHGWKAGETTRALGFLIIGFGFLGLWAGGALCARLQRRGVIDAPVRLGIPSAIGVILFLGSAMLMPTPVLSLAVAAPGLFCLALPLGIAGASLQLIFPNQLRGQVTALYLFILNLGGLPLGNLLPGVFNDYLFKNEKMLGVSVAMTIGICGSLMLILLLATIKPYRVHYRMMHPADGPTPTQ